MRKSIMIIALSTIVLTGFQINKSHKLKYKNSKSDRMIEKLKLTEDQEKKFLTIEFEKEEKVIELQSQMMKNRLNIKKLIKIAEYQKEDLLQLIDEASEIRSKLAKIDTEFWFDIKTILNKDQQEIWKKHLIKIGLIRNRMDFMERDKIMKERMDRGMYRERRSRRQFNKMDNL